MKKASLDRRNILRDMSFFSGSTYISQIMLFVKGFLNARILGPSLYGLWATLNIILKYSIYTHLGALNAMNREIPYHKGRGSTEGMDRVKDATFVFYMAMSLMYSAVLVVIAVALWKRLPLNEALGLIAIAFIGIAFSLFEFYETLLVGLKNFLVISKAKVIFSVLGIILTLILVPTLKIYGVYLVALFIPLSMAVYMWIKKPYRFRIGLDFKEIFRLIKIGFPILSIDFLEVSIGSIAAIIVVTLLGKTNMGYYSVAMLAGSFLMYFSKSVLRIFEPHMYQRYGETHDIMELKKYFFKPTLAMSLLFPVVAAFYYTGVMFFIGHFLPKYITAIYPLFIILIARFFVSFSPTAFALITAINKQRFLVPVYLVGTGIIALCAFIFIKMGFGITGVSFALLLAFFFTGSAIFMYAMNHYLRSGFKCLAYLAGLSAPILYMGAALYFTEYIIPDSFVDFSEISKLLLKLGVLCIFSSPLIYIAQVKTGILSDVLSFLKLDKLALKLQKSDLEIAG